MSTDSIIIVAAFTAGIVYAIGYTLLYTRKHAEPVEIPDSDVPFLIALGSTAEEVAEYRTMASRNRAEYGCTPGVSRSRTCPFKRTDARNDYQCGWCCKPARERHFLPL